MGKNTAQRPQPGLEPRTLDSESTNHAVTLSSYKLSQELQTATMITKCDSSPFFASFESPGSKCIKVQFSTLKNENERKYLGDYKNIYMKLKFLTYFNLKKILTK